MTDRPLVRVNAHAKINLSLRIGPAGTGGYHQLETVFQTLDLHDTVVVRRSSGPLVLTCDDPQVPAGRDNLVWRAADALWRAAGNRGAPAGVTITIHKRVPMQAGLGGGSSDAAAALRALNAVWGLRFDRPALSRLGAGIGADVPSFLVGGTSCGLGRGDDVYPLEEATPLHVVLAFPPFGVATKDAYRWLDEDRRQGRRGSGPAGAVDLWPSRRLEVVNDLAGPVVRRHPHIGRIRTALREAGALAAEMTGSGSTVFALFASPESARRGAEAAAGTDAWALVTRFSRRSSSRQ